MDAIEEVKRLELVYKEAIILLVCYLITKNEIIDNDEERYIRMLSDELIVDDSSKKIRINEVLAGKLNILDTEFCDSLNNITAEQKKLVLELVYDMMIFRGYIREEDVAYVVNVLELHEEIVISISKKYTKILKNKLKLQSKSLNGEKVSFKQRLKKNTISILSPILSHRINDQAKDISRQCLLEGESYSKSLSASKKIGLKDFSMMESSFKDVVENNERVVSVLESLCKASSKITKDGHEETKNLIEIGEYVKNFVDNNQVELNDILKRKKNALEYYTIAFLGRTKAGKSSLHSVLTGQGDDAIGVGQQRTTLINRSYRWQNIRIIDTPGIGAAEEGGRNDERIALKAVDEADIVCYVVTNDSIQEKEFQILKTIRDKNIPVIIILNVKENISKSIKKKRFIKDCLAWYYAKDEKSLKGHIERIKSYADKYYKNGYVQIEPIQVLAAKLSRDKLTSEEERGILYKGSRIGVLLDKIKVDVLKYSSLRRSQNILDGMVHTYDEYENNLEEYGKSLSLIINRLEKTKSDLKINCDTLHNKYEAYIRKDIDAIFTSWKACAQEFADNNYDEKKDVVKKLWSNECKGFAKQLEVKLKRRTNEFSDELTDDFNDIIQDLQLDFEKVIPQLSGERDWRKITNITGSLVNLGVMIGAGTAAWLGGAGLGAILAVMVSGPVGWVLFGITAVVGIVSSFLKSKDEIRKDKIEKLYKSLIKGIDEQKETVAKSCVSAFCNFSKKISSSLIGYFNTQIPLFEKCSREIEITRFLMKSESKAMNILYAKRIVEFMGYKSNEIKDVNRVQGKTFSIFMKKSFLKSNSKIKEVEQIIQEKLNIK